MFVYSATEQAPKFVREIKESRIKEGMRCRFEAVFAGNPKPEITWYYKGVQLQETDNIQIKVRATERPGRFNDHSPYFPIPYT